MTRSKKHTYIYKVSLPKTPTALKMLPPLLLPLLLLCGCIHQYPDPEASGVRVNVMLDVDLDTSLPLHKAIVSRAGEGTDGNTPVDRRRYIIDVYADGKALDGKRTIAFTTGAEENADAGAETVSIPLAVPLPPQACTLVVWSDLADGGADADRDFLTADLANLPLNADIPYAADCRRREAFCGMLQADLTPYADADGTEAGTGGTETEARLHVTLKRPQAKFTLIATDAQEFIDELLRRGGDPSRLSVKLSYEYYFPTAYNVTADVLCGSEAGMGFTAPLAVEADTEGKCPLASDFVFEGADPSYVVLTVEVADAAGKVLSRVRGLQVPLRQGHLTTVEGKFLTVLMKSGVSIDPGYEGEYNIYI